MKVSFTGKYLYTFDNENKRDVTYFNMKDTKNQNDNDEFDCFRIGYNKVLLLNGQDYKDYIQSLNLEIQTNTYTSTINNAHLQIMVNQADNIDCRKKYII